MSRAPRSRLYIGRVSSRTRERELEDLFGRYGRLLNCEVKQGYAFVEFDDVRDAEDAMRALDGHSLDGSRLIVEFSRGGRPDRVRRGPPDRGDYRISIEGVPRGMSWQDLKDEVRRVGDVVFADIFPDRSGGMRGIVEFRAKHDMERAVRSLDGTELRGSKIYVREEEVGRRTSPYRGRSGRDRRSPPRRSRRSASPRSPRRRSPGRRSPSPRRRSPSPRKRSPNKKRSPSPSRNNDKDHSPKRQRANSDSPERDDNDSKREQSGSPKRSPERSPSPTRDDGDKGSPAESEKED